MKEIDKRGILYYPCGVADDSDPLLPFQYTIINDDNDVVVKEDEVISSTTLNESCKRPSVKNTSSRKKAKTKKGELSMLKKLIEDLKTW